jgi:molybdopterin-guanine dinucleotide biosynthesis protein B
MVMKIFSIVGWSRSGKTTLVSCLVSHFKSKGRRVTAVKRAREYTLQPEAKDSAQFLEAGADQVWVLAGREMLNMKRVEDEAAALAILKRSFADSDIVLLEGALLEDVPLIEVFDGARGKSLKFPLEQLAAVVSDQKVGGQIPCFRAAEIERIALFMEAYSGKENHLKGK